MKFLLDAILAFYISSFCYVFLLLLLISPTLGGIMFSRIAKRKNIKIKIYWGIIFVIQLLVILGYFFFLRKILDPLLYSLSLLMYLSTIYTQIHIIITMIAITTTVWYRRKRGNKWLPIVLWIFSLLMIVGGVMFILIKTI